MVSRWGEPLARWIATALAALWVAGALVVVPFGCAVGEYEEDRDCTVPEIAVVSAVVLVVGVTLGIGTHRRPIHWLAIAAAAVLAAGGWSEA